MIASLTGVVSHVRLDSAILDVAGVGYLVYATPTTLSTMRDGEVVTVFTSMVVREDSMTLYAFSSLDEREVFETVQTVSGVGPRLALAMLAIHSSEMLRHAVSSSDARALTRVPGIGPKVAQRILLELSGKLAPRESQVPAPSAVLTDERHQVIEALQSLGWNAKQAEDTVAHVLAETGATGVSARDVPATLRSALKVLGGNRA